MLAVGEIVAADAGIDGGCANQDLGLIEFHAIFQSPLFRVCLYCLVVEILCCRMERQTLPAVIKVVVGYLDAPPPVEVPAALHWLAIEQRCGKVAVGPP